MSIVFLIIMAIIDHKLVGQAHMNGELDCLWGNLDHIQKVLQDQILALELRHEGIKNFMELMQVLGLDLY